MDQNYKKEYYYNNTVLTLIDNNHAVLVIYIENLNNKSDGYCTPIAYLSNNCWLLYMSKNCNVVENHVFWCNCIKYELIIDNHLLYEQWPVEISKIGWDFYGLKEESFEKKAEKLISEAKAIIAIARHERDANNLVKLLKDKKLGELELLLNAASEKGINMAVMLRQFKSFAGEYNLKEGSEILEQIDTAAKKLQKESKEQSIFVGEIQEYKEYIKLDNKEEAEMKEDEIQEEILQPEEKYHDHQEL